MLHVVLDHAWQRLHVCIHACHGARMHAHISTWGMQFVFVDNHFKIKDMLTSGMGDAVHIVGGIII